MFWLLIEYVIESNLKHGIQKILLCCLVHSGMEKRLYTHSCHYLLIVTKQEMRLQFLLHIVVI